MKTKYDWSNVPSDVESIATNRNDQVIGFESHNPMMTDRGWNTNYGYYYLNSQKPFNGNWQDSLEERPDDT